MAAAAAAVATLLLLLLRPAHFIRAPWGPDADELAGWAGRKPIVHGDPPFCRKSASIAVLPGADTNLQLLVWSGIGAWPAVWLCSVVDSSWSRRHAAAAPAPGCVVAQPVQAWDTPALADPELLPTLPPVNHATHRLAQGHVWRPAPAGHGAADLDS